MTVTVEIEGLSQVSAFLKKYGQEAEREIGKAVQKTALDIDRDVKKRIQRGPKSGRVYTDIFRMIGGRPVPIGPREGNNLSPSHQASAPGEAPASDTGGLSRSIYVNKSGPLEATVGSTLVYGYYLEFGTSRIAPRPAWTPAAELGQKSLNKRVEDVLRKAAQ